MWSGRITHLIEHRQPAADIRGLRPDSRYRWCLFPRLDAVHHHRDRLGIRRPPGFCPTRNRRIYRTASTHLSMPSPALDPRGLAHPLPDLIVKTR